MKQNLTKYRLLSGTRLGRVARIISLSVISISTVFTQTAHGVQAGQQTQYQNELQQVLNDKAGYADRIVQRWEASAKESGRWDENWHTNLYNALINLSPDNLLAADKATTFEGMMAVLANGPQQVNTLAAQPTSNSLTSQVTPIPLALGDITADLVYTPITPCRIVDTRIAGGLIAANTTRFFDVDGSTFIGQGGFNGPCGIPFGVARAVAMTVTVTQPSTSGFFKVWGLEAVPPVASVLNFSTGQTIANTTIVPVVPGGGNDFSLFSSATAHAVASVVGYFAAPTATALDCITVSSPMTTVSYNVWAFVDANCPAGRTVTGGGFTTPEGSLGRPNIWIDSLPNGANGWRALVDNQTGSDRRVQSYSICCRVPGR